METVTEILIDFSGSMKDKLSLTKEILLNDLIPKLDYSSKIGIRTFSLRKDFPTTTQILGLNITNREEIINAVNSLGIPDGGTPTSAAIRASVNALKEYPAFDKKIILVTDGDEDKGGDYVAETIKARNEGINCQVHIIGIGLNQKAQEKAQNISSITQGSFSSIPYTKSVPYNSNSVKSNLTNFYNSVKPTLVSTPASNIVQESSSNNRINPEIKKELQIESVEKTDEQEISTPENTETSEVLKLLISEIKDIKRELKELKNDKAEIVDIEEDIELNENIRRSSEEYLNEMLKRKYPDRVKWLNENGESNKDHDFEILDLDGTIEYYIECKGTSKTKPTFYLTKNEWRLFLNHTKNYQIYFIQNSFSTPTPIFIDNLLDWLLKGKLVPYIKQKEIIKEERVFLTITSNTFDN